jgi:hypothetical protein
MRRCPLVLLLPLILLAPGRSSAQPLTGASFTVSPDGNDAWSGRLSEPNASRTDGPFATPARARDAARKARREGANRGLGVGVVLRGGTYYLDRPLRLTPEDSGTESAPTFWYAYPGEKPVLSGGKRLTGWTVGEDGRWRLRVPSPPGEEWRFQQLYVNGVRRNRPRLPKSGFYYIAGEVPPSPAAGTTGADRFRFRQGDIEAGWHNLQDIEALCFQQWSMGRERFLSVDPTTRVVAFTGPTWNAGWMGGLNRGNRYLLENVAEALTEPGEWYLDCQTRELTYIPLPGETPETSVVVAPYLEHIVELAGDASLGVEPEWLRFEGVAFEHTNWVTPDAGWNFPQAEAAMPAAVTCTDTRDCVWERCTFRQVAGYAIEFGRACKRNRVESCLMTDLGAGGVRIGELFYRADESQCASDQVIRNNLIRGGGRTHPAGMGIVIGGSPRNVVDHNEIADFYNTGISVGWSWGYGPSNAHDNLITANRIHRLGQGLTSDMGGIYTLGLHDGTVLRDNVIYDVSCYPPGYGGWGIYFDEGTTHILAERNLVYGTSSGSLHQNYGKENVVRGNILALAATGQLQRSQVHDHLAFTVEGNIIYWNGGTLLGAAWPEDQFRFDRNLYWDASGAEVRFGNLSLAEWQALGRDVHSRIADPLFVDPAHADFALKPGSPALEMGFVPLTPEDAGCRLPDDLVAGLPELPRAFPPPEPVPAISIAEDFEACEVGTKAPGAATLEDEVVKEATARVTDVTAASGSRSLHMHDLPVTKDPWNPHMYYQPGYKEGVLEEHFDLRADTPDGWYHEWRTGGNPYIVGPSLHLIGGWLVCGERRIAEVPLGQWVGVDITCGVGPQCDGTWQIRVTLPGGAAPVEVTGLPCSPSLTDLTWWGFSCDGNAEADYYLDNLTLGPRR